MSTASLTVRWRIRGWLLAAIAASLAMVAVRVAGYPQLLRLPGGMALVVEACGLLVLYVPVILWATGRTPDTTDAAWRKTLQVAGIAAAVQVLHLLTERFVTFPGAWNGGVTLLFMASTFLCWGVAGYMAARLGRSRAFCVWLAVWSAMVTMTVAICFGVALELYVAPIPLESIRAWPEYQRSGWNDLGVFAIGNTLDSITSHLLLGPIVGAIVGLLGSLLGRFGISGRLQTSRL